MQRWSNLMSIFFKWVETNHQLILQMMFKPFISHLGFLEGEQPYLGDLLTMVIHHLQVLGWSSKQMFTPQIFPRAGELGKMLRWQLPYYLVGCVLVTLRRLGDYLTEQIQRGIYIYNGVSVYIYIWVGLHKYNMLSYIYIILNDIIYPFINRYSTLVGLEFHILYIRTFSWWHLKCSGK